MTRVLVGIDGSDLARHVAERALELVHDDADVTLATVVRAPLPRAAAAGIEVVLVNDQVDERALQAKVDEAEAELAFTARALGIPGAEAKVTVGDPGPTLCDVADQGGYDLLVVGSHGSDVLKRVLLGSVSHHVLNHARCPVLVIRRSDESEMAHAGTDSIVRSF